MFYKKETAGLIILLLACSAVAQETTGLGSLLTKIDANNKKIDTLGGTITTNIKTLEDKITARIDSLFMRLIIAMIGVQLFLIGMQKTLGGLRNFYQDRKKNKLTEEQNKKLDELTATITKLISMPQVAEIIEAASKIEKTPQRKQLIDKKILSLCFVSVTLILILNKLGVIS